MPRILGLSGSLRRNSFNASLLRAAVEVAPASLSIDVGTIRGIPLYDGDVEAQGIPAAVATLKDQVAAADGLLFVTPEYNNSIPGVFKNAVDWLSRPPADVPRLFSERPIAFMGTSPSRFGTLLSQTAWLPIVRTLGMRPWFGMTLYISEAPKVFDTSGTLIDPNVRERLKQFMTGYASYVTSLAR